MKTHRIKWLIFVSIMLIICSIAPHGTFSALENFSIWQSATVPKNPAVTDGQAIEVGVKFRSDVNSYVTGVRFYKGAGNTGTHVGSLWTGSGTRLASATFTNETASGWQEVLFPTAIAITANTTYVASYYSPSGYFAVDHAFFATSGVDTIPLHALANSISGGNGVYKYGSSGFPTQAFNSNNYWVDVVIVTTAPPVDTTPPTVASFTVPATAAALTVSITTLIATDSVGVTGYLVNESSTPPAATASGWTATAPNSYTFATPGSKGLYAWAKDAAGNVSTGVRADIAVTLADLTVPIVTAFTMPATSASLTVPISAFTASDNVAVTGYCTTSINSSSGCSWSTVPPAEHIFIGSGTVTAYAWARDAAGNVSTAAQSQVTITVRPRLMPLGDSYTRGINGDDVSPLMGYRDHLQNLLGINNWMFVGPYSDPPGDPAFQVTHAGKDGDLTSQVAARLPALLPAFLPLPNPANSLILIHCGGIDIESGYDLQTAAVTVGAMVDTIDAYDPSVSVLVDLYPPRFNGTDARAVTYNGYLTTVIGSKKLTKPNLYLVDLRTTFAANPNVRTQLISGDGVHLLDAGFTLAAQIYYAQIQTILTPPDAIPPAVTTFSVPATSVSLTVPITTFSASDNVGVSGYLITESATAPLPTANGWSAMAQSSYTFSSAGTKILYAWVRDAAGNISTAKSAPVAITLTSYKIWPATAIPQYAAVSDGQAIEVGVKFSSEVNSFVSGLRYYKGAGNTGTHVGHLWNRDGILLASSTFTNETSAGWQEVLFTAPVAITANTTYVASYYSPSGYFAVNQAYFTSGGVDNPPLHALANGVDGGNGVYRYGNSSFPTQTFNANNYWVDVVLSATAPPADSIPPTVTAFTVPSTASSLTVAITRFTATDNIAVTGYLATESSSAPVPTASGWSSTAPSTYAFATAGSKILYGWVKDGAGNVSAGRSAAVTITMTSSGPESPGWYAGDMHVHRSCGAAPESVSNIFQKILPQNLSVISLLADMGNGEVQDPALDLPRVTGQDDPLSTPGRTLHWDAEWHWDPTYFQYPFQALGGHVVSLGLVEAHEMREEYTYPVFNWARQQKAISGFPHMQYLDNTIPQSLNCCAPLEYPVEVALGMSDFISEDVVLAGSGQPGMCPDCAIQAYYRLLNCGFRPGLAAGTDYPCNNNAPLGSLLTYVQVTGGTMSYRSWIDGIAKGRTVISRNGHNEFLDLKVNSIATPGDEIKLTGGGSMPVTVQWNASQSLSGTIELVQNGVVVASNQTIAGPGIVATLNATVNFTKSGWLAARRMGVDGHHVHTGAVFVTVDNAPVRASKADADFYVQWIDNLLVKTSPGGVWNSYFVNSLSQAQARYQAAKALYQQISLESGTPPVPPAQNSIFTGQIPTLYENDSAYELGTRFRADVNGTITQVRIYTNAAEGGTHTVRLWRVQDTAVVAGPYTWDIAQGTAGWRTFALPTAVAITANTDYIVAVSNSNDLYYAEYPAGFSAPIISGHLNTSVGSGVYTTTMGTMPTLTWQNTNYFRDIVFVP